MPMYDWHAKHPEKGIRFSQAMESVSQSKLVETDVKKDGSIDANGGGMRRSGPWQRHDH